MKILLALLFISAGASAATLGAAECGALKQCISVPNDAALDVSIYAAPQYAWVHLYIDGVAYYAPYGNGMVIDNVPFQASDGRIVWLSATFTNYKTCVKSGRGQTCTLHWSLVTGTLTNG